MHLPNQDVTQIKMCPETKSLCVAGASAQVMYFSFKKKDTQTETKSMEIPIVYEVSNISHGGTKPDSNSPNSQGKLQLKIENLIHKIFTLIIICSLNYLNK